MRFNALHHLSGHFFRAGIIDFDEDAVTRSAQWVDAARPAWRLFFLGRAGCAFHLPRAMQTPEKPWWKLLTPYHWFVFIVASAAWFFDCLDQRLFSLARIPALASLMGMPAGDPAVQAYGKVVTAKVRKGSLLESRSYQR